MIIEAGEDPSKVKVLDAKSLLSKELELDESAVLEKAKQRFGVSDRADSGLLQLSLRWISDSGHAIIFEVPPSRHLMTFTRATAHRVFNQKVHDILINVPRTIIGAIISDFVPVRVWTYVVNGPLVNYHDRLYVLPLPNIYSSNMVCLPHEGLRMDNYDISGAMRACYEVVWDSRNNMDLQDACRTVRSQQRPSAIYDDINRRFKASWLRRHPNVSPSHLHIPPPTCTPLQVMRSWARLKPHQVAEINDWGLPAQGSPTFGHLISNLQSFPPQTNFLPHHRLERALFS